MIKELQGKEMNLVSSIVKNIIYEMWVKKESINEETIARVATIRVLRYLLGMSKSIDQFALRYVDAFDIDCLIMQLEMDEEFYGKFSNGKFVNKFSRKAND